MDGWTGAVRHQLDLGRVLPLGGPRDGAWIVETAARAVLREAVREVPGVRPGVLRLAPADPQDAREPVVPAPPSGLAPGPLRITAEFAAVAAEPLPATAARVRGALARAADGRLGLLVTEIDLRVTALLDEPPPPERTPARAASPAAPVPDGAAARAARAALSVPGVTALTDVLGRAVHWEERTGDANALPRPHARVECAVAGDRRALDVAREVRAAVAAALPDHPTVAVLVTAVT